MRLFFLSFATALICAVQAQAFCGFYVARADGALYNQASKVVYMRDKRQSVITMSSDYRGAAKDFAMIVPTPMVLKRDQVRTVPTTVLDHLDAYTAPRLVEYHDRDPCNLVMEEPAIVARSSISVKRSVRSRAPRAFGVTIKEEYAVGIYDIVILAAEQSDGLVTWLTTEGYAIPDGAGPTLDMYIKGGMKFFVARVNLKRHSAAQAQLLEPLQISFKSKDFMLPLQLGKINGDGPQDVLLMTLTRTGRVEAANYANHRIPSDVNIPSFVKSMFGDFYKAMFDRQMASANVVTEYAWDMAWCDPCAADPLSREELQQLGVSWLKSGDNAGQDVFVTRLHLRYDQTSMRNDLMMTETRDRSNFQGRYVMNHPFTGRIECEAGKAYVRDIRARLRAEAVDLQELTGWSPRKIEQRIRASVPKDYW